MRAKPKKRNSLLWLFEPLEDDPGFIQRKLFSFDAAYLDGSLYVAVGDHAEPWSGLLVCTDRKHHAALISEFPMLDPHQVIGKWLHISQSHPQFESTATEIIDLAAKRDGRLGIFSCRHAPQEVRRLSCARWKTAPDGHWNVR